MPSLTLFNQPLLRKYETKFLGMYIDEKLSWKPHVHHVLGKISRMIGILAKLQSVLTLSSMKTIYFSLIHSHILYGIIFWSFASKTERNKVFIIQKKIIRIISNSNRLDHSEPLFKRLNILKLDDLWRFEMSKFV